MTLAFRKRAWDERNLRVQLILSDNERSSSPSPVKAPRCAVISSSRRTFQLAREVW
ncbi:hypothetical protein DSECCO2_363740 [anaerobic digester metagenome]